MTVDDLIRPVIRPGYYGRFPDSIGGFKMSDDEIKDLGYVVITRMPPMLKAVLRTEVITRAWRSDCFGRGREYYIVDTEDGDRFIVT